MSSGVIVLKIVMVAPFAAYPKGTVGVRILPIGKALRKRGFEVFVVIPPYDNPMESGRVYEVDGVKVLNIRFRNIPFFKYTLTLLSLLFTVYSLKPNAVYFFKPKGYGGLLAISVAFLKRLFLWYGLGLVLDMDDWEGWGGFCDFYYERSVYPRFMLNFFDFQERWIPKHVDAITVASLTLKERVLSWGIPRDRIFYVPNGAPLRSFNVDMQSISGLRDKLDLANSRVILLYTRFFEYNVQRVVEVFRRVRLELDDVKLFVVGRGEFGEEERLKELLKSIGLEDFVVFVGWVEPNDIPKYVAIGDVAIYPFDNNLLNRAKCPGKVIELMTAGKAIVADKVGQIAEYIVDGESGLLVEPGDVERFAQNIIKSLKDEKLRMRLGIDARKRALEIFCWKKLTENVEDAILQSTLVNRTLRNSNVKSKIEIGRVQ